LTQPRKPWPPVVRLHLGSGGGDLGTVEPDAAVEVYPGLSLDEAEVYRLLGIDPGASDDEVLALLADRSERRRAHLVREADAYGLYTRDGDHGDPDGWGGEAA